MLLLLHPYLLLSFLSAIWVPSVGVYIVWCRNHTHSLSCCEDCCRLHPESKSPWFGCFQFSAVFREDRWWKWAKNGRVWEVIWWNNNIYIKAFSAADWWQKHTMRSWVCTPLTLWEIQTRGAVFFITMRLLLFPRVSYTKTDDKFIYIYRKFL